MLPSCLATFIKAILSHYTQCGCASFLLLLEYLFFFFFVFFTFGFSLFRFVYFLIAREMEGEEFGFFFSEIFILEWSREYWENRGREGGRFVCDFSNNFRSIRKYFGERGTVLRSVGLWHRGGSSARTVLSRFSYADDVWPAEFASVNNIFERRKCFFRRPGGARCLFPSFLDRYVHVPSSLWMNDHSSFFLIILTNFSSSRRIFRSKFEISFNNRFFQSFSTIYFIFEGRNSTREEIRRKKLDKYEHDRSFWIQTLEQ